MLFCFLPISQLLPIPMQCNYSSFNGFVKVCFTYHIVSFDVVVLYIVLLYVCIVVIFTRVYTVNLYFGDFQVSSQLERRRWKRSLKDQNTLNIDFRAHDRWLIINLLLSTLFPGGDNTTTTTTTKTKTTIMSSWPPTLKVISTATSSSGRLRLCPGHLLWVD